MRERFQLLIEPEYIDQPDHIRCQLQKIAGHLPLAAFKIIKRSIDARSKSPKFVLQIEMNDEKFPDQSITSRYPSEVSGEPILIVGAGPAGYFAALELIERGVKPVILERGKAVRERGKDIRQIYKHGRINPDSNFCFGEGGAGTYSDGKLYTRSDKRGDVSKVLKLLVEHGASEDILIEAHPHIGSDKLPTLIKNIRSTILNHGGEIHFESRVTGLILADGKITGVRTQEGSEFFGRAVILAAGHSARELFDWLYSQRIAIQAKPSAIGVRVEHPQPLIDQIQYHQCPRPRKLPAATYRLSTQIDGRGVYSFCMCPGGYIVPASTGPGELVVNGMSFSKRNAPFANSGMVVEIRLEDIPDYESFGPMAMLEFQKKIEKRAFEAGGGSGQQAPAQRMTDFVSGRVSSTLPKTSYLPGVQSAAIHDLLPNPVRNRLQKAFREFGKKMKGYFTQEAVLIAVESRTSSPITIPRDSVSLMHPQIRNLYPCGEGAGHSGGIVSSAMDGQRAAEQITAMLQQR